MTTDVLSEGERAREIEQIEQSRAAPSYLVADIEHTLLNLLVDLSGGLDEGLLDIVGCLGAGLQEDETVLASKLLAFLDAHGSPVIEVALVADQHDGHVGVGMLTGILEPRAKVVEGLTAGRRSVAYE